MGRFLACVYAFKFADAFILIYPLYAVMFVEAGMTAGEVGAALAVWSVTAFVIQMPAGVWADRWSRRAILSLAQVSRLVGFALWLAWPHFWGFLAGFVLWGIKSGRTGGCFAALVYDELKAAGREADYTRIAGRAEAIQFVGVLAASLAAAPLAVFGYPALLAGSLAACAVAAALPFAFPKAPHRAATGDLDYLAHLKLGLSQVARTPVLLGLVAFIAVAMALGALDEFWSIFASRAGLDHSAVALFIAAISAGQAAASFLAHRMRRLASGWFYALFALNGALLALAAAIFRPAAVLLLVAFSAGGKVIDIVFEGRLQAAMPSQTRATIGSVKGFVVEVAVTFLYLGFGPLAQATSYRTAFLATGALIGALGLKLLAWELFRSRPPPTAPAATLPEGR
jgi:MFS family permease